MSASDMHLDCYSLIFFNFLEFQRVSNLIALEICQDKRENDYEDI